MNYALLRKVTLNGKIRVGNFKAQGLQIGPLLREQLKKDVLEGALQSKVTIAMAGDDADQIKRSLNGDGELVFNDGAIKGIDLPGMVRNVEAKFGLVKKGGGGPCVGGGYVLFPYVSS